MKISTAVQDAATLSVTDAYGAATERGAFLLDVRSNGEFASAHAANAVCIPVTELDQRIAELPTDRPILVMCQSGQRSAIAVQKLRARGMSNISDVSGGFSAWEKANLPLIRGNGAIPLERQVRIAAGTLVFAFSLVGFLLNHYFFYGALAIGFMLAFTGIVGICPMMSLLMIMPWNRRSE